MKFGTRKILLPTLTATLLVLGWQAVVSVSGAQIFPTPWKVVTGLAELMQKGLLLKYIVASLFRVSAGFLLALILGIPLGLLIGWYSRAYEALNPIIQILRPISPIAWIPVSILWFGVSDLAPIFLILLASVFPITTAAAAAVREIPEAHLRAARNFGVTRYVLFVKVVFPAALPQIITGVRLGLGIAWMVVVAAEMIAVNSGLGYLIIDARNAGMRYDLVVSGMVLIGLIGLLLDFLMRSLEHMDEVRWGFNSLNN